MTFTSGRRGLLVALLVVGVVLSTPASGLAAAERLPNDSDTTLLIVEQTRTPEQPTVDENVSITATVRSLENGEADYFVTDVLLYEEPDAGGDVLARNDSRELLAPGGTVRKAVETDFDDAGRENLSVRIRLRTMGGEPITLVRPVTLRVRDSHPEFAVQAQRVGRSGETTLNLSLANGDDEPIRSLSLRLRGAALTVEEPTRVQSVLQGGETATFDFDASDATSGATDLDARLGYTAADGERRVIRRSLDLSLRSVRNPANITLTDIRLTDTDRGVEIRGSASNVGSTDAQSVSVAVLDGSNVAPAVSQSTFFVGTVPASDFNAFDVAATVHTNETVSIPLRVSFVADDVEVERTVEVRYTPERSEDPVDSGPDSLVLGAAVALLLVLIGAVLWRRYR